MAKYAQINMNKLLGNKLLRYGVAGATSTTVNLTLTWVLERLGVHYIAVVTVAFGLSVIVSFLLQKFFTFANRSVTDTHKQFALFVVIALVNLAANDGLVYVQYTLLHLKQLVVVEAVASFIIAFYSYFLYRYLFRGRRPGPDANV